MIKFIDNNKEISECLADSMDSYNHYYWSVAWMGKPDKLYEKLIKNKHKIELLVTGLYGFNKERVTSHKFIEDFRDLWHIEPNIDNNTRVIFLAKKYSRDFSIQLILHSKLYYFENSDSDWRLVVGSANFSQNAFNSNLEAVVVCDQESSFSNESVKDYFARIRCEKGNNYRRYTEKEVEYYVRKCNQCNYGTTKYY